MRKLMSRVAYNFWVNEVARCADYASEKGEIIITVNMHGGVTYVTGKNGRKTGVAKCCPDDMPSFSYNEGVAIAYTRYKDRTVPVACDTKLEPIGELACGRKFFYKGEVYHVVGEWRLYKYATTIERPTSARGFFIKDIVEVILEETE